MSEEDEACRLTFEEGRKIRNEAERPYGRKAIMYLGVGAVIPILFQLLADFKYDVLWKGIKGIEERILQGDFQAIIDWNNYNGMTNAGLIFAIIFFSVAGYYAYVGDKKGKEALKEANDRKAER